MITSQPDQTVTGDTEDTKANWPAIHSLMLHPQDTRQLGFGTFQVHNTNSTLGASSFSFDLIAFLCVFTPQVLSLGIHMDLDSSTGK